MSTNIITGFEITNELTITDGQLSINTNDTNNSLDISGNITIGNTNNPYKSKLIIKDLSDAEINLLITKNSSNNIITHKIKNKNGNLLFENDNNNKTNYEFKLDSNNSIGFLASSDNNEAGIIFGKNSSNSNGIQTYNNGNITS